MNTTTSTVSAHIATRNDITRAMGRRKEDWAQAILGMFPEFLADISYVGAPYKDKFFDQVSYSFSFTLKDGDPSARCQVFLTFMVYKDRGPRVELNITAYNKTWYVRHNIPAHVDAKTFTMPAYFLPDAREEFRKALTRDVSAEQGIIDRALLEGPHEVAAALDALNVLLAERPRNIQAIADAFEALGSLGQSNARAIRSAQRTIEEQQGA